MLQKVSGWILLLLSFNSLALTQTRLLTLSQSQQTVVFDAGVHNGLSAGEFGIVLKQVKDIADPHALRVLPVAKVRSVKIATDHSIWVIFKVFGQGLWEKGEVYTLFTESNMIPGRREYQTAKLTSISHAADPRVAAAKSLGDDADRLAKAKNYRKDYSNHSSSYKSDVDFELIELEKWNKHKSQRYRSGLYRSQNAQEFKRALRLEVFEGLVTRYLQRVNDPDFVYATFYDEQMRESGSNYFRKRSNFSTAWENHQHQSLEDKEKSTKLARTLLEKGERWSEDYSDEELGQVLANISVLQEKDRKARVISKPARYQLALDYGQIMSDHQSSEDPLYLKSMRSTLSLDFEVIPVLKHEIWERFSLNAQIAFSDDAMAVGAKNYDRRDQSFTLGVNWYPLYSPYTISALNFYLGAYFRAGQSKLRSDFYAEKGNYTLLSIPGFRAGLRYNFKNQISLRFVGSMETVNLEKTGSSEYYSELPGSVVKNDMNLALGLGYSF